jgi:hypothetical protein
LFTNRVALKEHGAGGLEAIEKCCVSMKFWCGSGCGSKDPYLLLMDPDPAIFVSDLHDINLLLFEGTFTSFFKDKKS